LFCISLPGIHLRRNILATSGKGLSPAMDKYVKNIGIVREVRKKNN
jgi:hypothetical protein